MSQDKRKMKHTTGVVAIVLAFSLMSGSVVYAMDIPNFRQSVVFSGVTAYDPISLTDTKVTAGAVEAMSKLQPTVVAEPILEEVVEAPVLDEDAGEWAGRLMADVDEFVNVRSEANAESKLAGKLRKGDLAEIVEDLGDWIKIKSGNLEGYVSREFCVTGLDAKALSEEVCKQYAVANTGGLRIREEQDVESDIVAVIGEQERVRLNIDADEIDPASEWVAVKHEDGEGYVSAEFITIETDFGKGITVEEEAAAIAKAEEAKKAGSGRSKGAGVAAGADDVTLLAALIQAEAGNTGYDGLLAVGAVVVNRAKRGYAGGSIRGVITQPGQFPPATNGIVDGILARGVSGSCIQAAQEALSGVDNTGGATGFRSAKSGYAGVVIGGNVFY